MAPLENSRLKTKLNPNAHSRPPRFDLLAFDWDGTLFDSTQLITRCIQNAAVAVGGEGSRPSHERASYVIGMNLCDALKHVAPDFSAQQQQTMLDHFRSEYLQHQDDLTLFQGILPMLQALKARHIWLTVATGKNRRGLDRCLAAKELQGIFDGSRTADETAGKPSPLMLQELMREFGAEPERTLVIGDTTHDLQMAKNAGCHCVAVAYGAHKVETFVNFEPLYIAHTPAQLATWLQNNT